MNKLMLSLSSEELSMLSDETRTRLDATIQSALREIDSARAARTQAQEPAPAGLVIRGVVTPLGVFAHVARVGVQPADQAQDRQALRPEVRNGEVVVFS